MPRVAILIAASPTRAFYSQVAALTLAVHSLPWSRWEPTVHLFVGGDHDADAYEEWRPHLRQVTISRTAEANFARERDWAQADDAFRFAPRDADVLLAMDADTLPVASLEAVLDETLHAAAIAGVIAHAPFPLPAGISARQAWDDATSGLIDVPLDFAYAHTLMPPDSAPSDRLAPFYVNFGVVFFPRRTFDDVMVRYLAIRPRLMTRVVSSDFSGQVALTLAITAARAKTLALPMRYNFPNDPLAAQLYPRELADVAIFHYLRTGAFDRHVIFTSDGNYRDFLARPLTGVDQAFQRSARTILGRDYPFPPTVHRATAGGLL